MGDRVGMTTRDVKDLCFIERQESVMDMFEYNVQVEVKALVVAKGIVEELVITRR